MPSLAVYVGFGGPFPFARATQSSDAVSRRRQGRALARQGRNGDGGPRESGRSDRPKSGPDFAGPFLQRVAAPNQKNEALRLTETRRVLVIDDNIDAADSFGTMLTLFGHDVRTVYSGLEALAIARESHPLSFFATSA